MLDERGALELITTVPRWADASAVTGLRPLAGGLTNQSFTFERDGEPYVLRVNGANAAVLGIDREAEFAAATAAGAAGVGPEVIHCFRPDGHLVRRYTPGRPADWPDLTGDHLARTTDLLRRAHRLGPTSHTFDPIRDIRRRLSMAAAANVPLPPDTNALADHATAIAGQHWSRPESDCGLCHVDPFASNFVIEEGTGRLLLVDWEFAGMGDVYWDLACTSIVLPDERKAEFLAAYFGAAPQGGLEKLLAIRTLMWTWNWTWAVLQAAGADAQPTHATLREDLLAAIRNQLPAGSK
jgi:thiamine kinase-like enzyme